MRYADCPAVTCDVHVEADPERVWQLVTNIDLHARFSSELQRVQWLDDASEATLDARFEGHNSNPALGEWRSVSWVVELDAPRAFTWVVVDPDGWFGPSTNDPQTPSATWRFNITPEDGGVRLQHAAQIGPARSGLSVLIDRMPEKEEMFIEHRLASLRSSMEQTLHGIKSLAEQPS